MVESKTLLKLYGIPVNEVLVAKSASEAVEAAEKIGFPVVMKIHSTDISHKQDVGGVLLNLINATMVNDAYTKMMNSVAHLCPSATILGVTIEHMYTNPNNRELMIGVINDKVFGPVISFGAGGSLVEVMHDRAIELPPLNSFLAERLIARTRIAKALGPFRHMPAVNQGAIIDILLRISDLICDIPNITELDINPLIVNDREAIAIDARIVIGSNTNQSNDIIKEKEQLL